MKECKIVSMLYVPCERDENIVVSHKDIVHEGLRGVVPKFVIPGEEKKEVCPPPRKRLPIVSPCASTLTYQYLMFKKLNP